MKRYTSHTLYSKKVSYFKKFFGFLALILILAVFAWPRIEALFEPEAQENTPESQINVTNQLIKPRIKSVDEQGRPYALKAETAEHTDKGQADLSKPESELELEGKKIKITADKGHFREHKNTLEYQGNVHLDIEGHQFTTDQAEVDFNKRQAVGSDPIAGKGPLGEITAEKGFEVDQQGQLVFKGRTKIIFSGKKN